jgi:hypothetical protein
MHERANGETSFGRLGSTTEESVAVRNPAVQPASRSCGRCYSLLMFGRGHSSHMKLKILAGAGGCVMGFILPFSIIGVTANIIWPPVSRAGSGRGGLIAGIVLLVVGVLLHTNR